MKPDRRTTATHSSHSGMGAILRTHILKGSVTLCGLKPDFDSPRWTKDRYTFNVKTDCQKCANKTGAVRLAKETRKIVRDMNRLEKSDKILRRLRRQKAKK